MRHRGFAPRPFQVGNHLEECPSERQKHTFLASLSCERNRPRGRGHPNLRRRKRLNDRF
jgi:hypothetical protein